jgi:hypothetical protein
MPRPNWVDDPAIPPDARLWRGVVTPDDIRTDADGNDVPSLGSLVTGEMSVELAAESTLADMFGKAAAAGVQWRIWEFTAGEARNAVLIVDRDPQPEDPAHCVVLRADEPGKRLKESQAKKLIKGGHWAN